MNGINLPDLRFEQSFMKLLAQYAGNPPKTATGLSDQELELLGKDVDEEEQRILEGGPLSPITPGIVVYALIKDQIIMPLLQGFLWTGLLIAARLVLQAVVRNGQMFGAKLYNLVGLKTLLGRPATAPRPF